MRVIQSTSKDKENIDEDEGICPDLDALLAVAVIVVVGFGRTSFLIGSDCCRLAVGDVVVVGVFDILERNPIRSERCSSSSSSFFSSRSFDRSIAGDSICSA